MVQLSDLRTRNYELSHVLDADFLLDVMKSSSLSVVKLLLEFRFWGCPGFLRKKTERFLHFLNTIYLSGIRALQSQNLEFKDGTLQVT